MSRTKTSNLQHFTFTEHNMVNDFRKNLETDEDFNGNNGPEYLSEEAQKGGFESDFEYALDKAQKKSSKLKGPKKVDAFIKSLISSMKTHGGDFYDNTEYDVIQVGITPTYVVAFLIETVW